MNARGIPPVAYQVLPSAALSGGVPTLDRGYLPWPGCGVPTLAGGTYPGQGGISSLDRGVLSLWGIPHLDLASVPLGVDRQTPVKTVPSPILLDAGGNKTALH